MASSQFRSAFRSVGMGGGRKLVMLSLARLCSTRRRSTLPWRARWAPTSALATCSGLPQTTRSHCVASQETLIFRPGQSEATFERRTHGGRHLRAACMQTLGWPRPKYLCLLVNPPFCRSPRTSHLTKPRSSNWGSTTSRHRALCRWTSRLPARSRTLGRKC